MSKAGGTLKVPPAFGALRRTKNQAELYYTYEQAKTNTFLYFNVPTNINVGTISNSTQTQKRTANL